MSPPLGFLTEARSRRKTASCLSYFPFINALPFSYHALNAVTCSLKLSCRPKHCSNPRTARANSKRDLRSAPFLLHAQLSPREQSVERGTGVTGFIDNVIP